MPVLKMGGILTTAKESFIALRALAGVLRQINHRFKDLSTRINADPGLPTAKPTKSYWLQDPPYPHLDDAPTHIPEAVDVVIVGSGITAASVARTLLLLHPGLTIAVLEARNICSGATGRNGGHIKVAPYEDLDRLTKQFGRERAVELVRFQLRHLDCLVGMCEKEGLDIAECRVVETADFFVESFDEAKRKVFELRQEVPEVEIKLWEAEEARKVRS
jgi:hypothetical protein